ncbi:diheme cytochrome c [Rhodoferax sp. UBA5149]|uniref:diheme cytochrome c n=1 Tax=Rhodoferax sp. UBA5149 TaxID=1947379 RepID=UPI0025CD7179|nr:diheme cytochrome c [Rhodoferax sp. UBA5149]
MLRSNFNRLSLALLLAAGTVTAAHADDHGSKGPMAPVLPKYQQECASCHLAYPAGMLPAASWQRVMSSLGQHYGTDASLDAASVRELSSWLKTNAGSYKRVSEEPPQDRITKSAWFLRQHRDGEVPAGVWKRASVGSPSNCTACHGNAAQGNFNEHDVRIPK